MMWAVSKADKCGPLRDNILRKQSSLFLHFSYPDIIQFRYVIYYSMLSQPNPFTAISFTTNLFLFFYLLIFLFSTTFKLIIMFKRVNDEQLLRKGIKEVPGGSLNKLRILDSIPLKKLNDSDSSHSSVMTASLHGSVKNLANASVNSSISSEFSLRSSLLLGRSREKGLLPPKLPSREEEVQLLLERHFARPFTKSLIQFLNKDWNSLEREYLQEKKLQNFVGCVIQRGSWLKDLVDEYLEKQYQLMTSDDRRAMASLLFRESSRAFKDLETIIPQIIKKIPEERLLIQETLLQELQNKLLEIYDPKFAYSNNKMKERISLYLEDYTSKRNSLKSEVCTKLKPSLQFVEEVEGYFAAYQKQILRLKSQLSALELQKNKYQEMLTRKSNFQPVQVDYDRLYDMKEKAQLELRHDLEVNIIQFHQEKHIRNDKKIASLQESNAKIKEDNEALTDEVAKLRQIIGDWKKNQPLKFDQGTQVFMIAEGKGSEAYAQANSGFTVQFLQNVITPFSFSKEITGSLINVLTVDKILYDYDTVRSRLGLVSFEQFVLEWFIIRTGCKKVAQIFVKNFQYSLKQLKTTHKRFWLFQKLCGWSGYRGRNMQEDLENIFFSTHLCWYYLVRLTLMYRKKLSQNPTGFHIMPPLPCEDIFKLPLRKVYDIIEEFLKGEDIEIPSDLTQRIDHYCINEISKFKSGDEEFQKQALEEIHILREINFDLIAGFVLEYVATLKCGVVEKLLRTIQNKQRQEGNVLAYAQFQIIYRRFYKERRAKIELIFSKLCLTNQHDMLDVQNMAPVVRAILEDESPLRSAFEKLQSLKVLILSEKAALMKGEKKLSNPNSYQNFRDRFYHEFYDFYSTTAFLEEIFRIIRALVKKRLKKGITNEQQIAKLIDNPPLSPSISSRKGRKGSISKKKDESSEQESESASVSVSEDRSSVYKKSVHKQGEESKDFFVNKLEQWGKIITRVPHFAANVLTIDQIVIHNMRRKEMIEASEFAWKTLREILSVLGKQ